MKTLSLPAAALAAGLVLTPAFAQAQAGKLSLAGSQAPKRIVGTWEFPDVHVFDCISGQTFARFRASSLFHADGTMQDTNNTPTITRGPAFGVWNYHAATDEYVIRMRLYRYNPDGSFAGSAEVTRTARLSGDGNQMSETFRGKILDPAENVLVESCGSGEGTRSL